jgi:hypothetical protein
MASLAAEFPPLPDHFDGGHWTENVIQAHSILSSAYHGAYEAFHASESDAHCLRLHSDRLMNRMFPILEVMEPELLSHEWLKSAAETIAGLYLELEGAALMVDNVYVVIYAYFIKNTMINVISSETSTLKKPVKYRARLKSDRSPVGSDGVRQKGLGFNL